MIRAILVRRIILIATLFFFTSHNTIIGQCSATISASSSTICEGTQAILTSSPGNSYLWSTGATTQSISVSASGSYFVTVIDEGGCSATSSATAVTVNPLPTASITASGATTFCEGASVTLTSSPGSSYLWSTGAVTQSISISLSGSYTVAVTDANGCSATSAATAVTVNPLPTVSLSASGPTTFCQGASVTLTSSPGSVYLWSTGETTPNITVSSSGSYSVTVTDANGCSATSAATAVTVNPLPTASITASGATTFCEGASVTLTSSPGNSYLWSTGAVSQSINISSSGCYSVTITDENGCSATSAATAVTVNPLPTASITASGPTTFCHGASVTLTSSPGSSYLWSTGAISQSINISSSGSYSVMVTDANGCSATSVAISVIVNSLPAVYTVTGGGTYCSGGTGLPVGISNSQNGVSYQLYKDGIITGGTINGSGSAISFGNQTVAGTYTVIATNPTTSCSVNMTGSATISVNPLPTAFNVTGGGSYCLGGTGVSIGLSGSQTGVNYQLRIGASNSGSPVSGTGAAISFGLRTTAGTYTVVATDATTSCTQNMSGSATITVNPLPTAFNVTGGGSYCSGGIGVAIGLSGSQDGVNYQLRLGGVNTGSIVPGTGSAISFGNQTAAGTYTAIAVDATTSCTQNMNGSAAITINSLPTAYNVTGGGSYCSGGPGLAIVLSGSQNGVTYQLRIGAVNSGASVNGTGAAISFGLRTGAGTYTVIATNSTTSCTQIMTGSASISVNPLPTVFNVTGGGSYCSGGAGIVIGLSGSEIGINYQLRLGGANTGSIVQGTGSSISFGNQTVGGTYTVLSIDATTSCTQNMLGSAVINVNQLPTVASISGPTTVCTGSTITLTNTTAGGTWSSSNSEVATISSAGVVSGIAGGPVTIYYSVTNANGCTRTVSRAVTVNSTSITVAAAGPTTFCRGNSVTLTASGATSYIWSPVDGLSITNGPTVIASPEIVTTYTVTGTGATGCIGTAQVTVTVNQSPEAIMSSDPAVCSGNNSGTVNLTISDGSTVLGWQSSTNGGTTWSSYSPSVNQYTTTYENLTQTTVYRALLQLNGCQGFSSIGIIPVNNVLSPIVTASATVTCLNTAVTLNASGYGQPPFPVEDFQNANPAGWSGDDAAGNNEDPNSNWALTTNGKVFNGRPYNSQALPTNTKFLIVTGLTDEADHNATLTAPPFSLVGTINPILSFYTALNFNSGTTGTVEISTDGGITFTTLISYIGPREFGNTNNGWVNVTYSLVPYINQPDVRIRFNYTGTAGSNWGLDNIGIISSFQPIVYQWTPLDHMTPPTGDTPTVTILPDVGLHQYCVTSTTAAGCESESVCIEVNVLPLPVCSINGTDNPVCPSSVNSFTAPAGMNRYVWSIIGNGRITAGAGTQNVTVTAGVGCSLPFTITLTITDINGCVSTCSKTVMVEDLTPPTIICPPVNAQYRMNTGLSYYVAVGTEFNATATDNCTITSLTHNLPYSSSTTLEGYHFAGGLTTVTWTAIDACGLRSICQIIINVIDDQPPVITCPPAITVQCAADVPSPYFSLAAFIAAGGVATDNNQINPASFSVYGTDVITNQSCVNRYTITRTYQVIDISGNIARCTQTITVNDQTPPVIGCPANKIFCETQNNSFTIPILTATDNCGGAVNITFVITGSTERTGSGNDASGHFNIGASTITWTVTDVCGNVSTCITGVLINPLPGTSPIYHR